MDSVWVKDNLVFIGIPKNAGTSIIRTLGMEKISRKQYNYREGDILFAVWRDPFTRIVSAYIEVLRARSERGVILAKEFYKCKDEVDKSFKLFLDDINVEEPYNQHIRRQVDFIERYKEYPIRWLTFENIEQDFASFTEEVTGKPIELSHDNHCVDVDRARKVKELMRNQKFLEGQVQIKYYEDYALRLKSGN